MERYTTYKDTGVEWIGQIPSHWEKGRLKYFNLVVMGQSPESSDYTDNQESLPFLQGNAEFGTPHPCASIYCDTANKTAAKDDILISVRAPVGAINISDKVYGIGRGLAAVRSPNRSMYNYYFLQATKEYLDSLSTGSTFTAVSVEDIKNIPYPSIPLPEQEAIASYLDRKTKLIDDLIAKKERLIELKKEERAAIINQAVTKGLDPDVKMKDSGIEWLGEIPERWDILSMKYVCLNILDGTHGSFARVDDGYRLLSVRNIIDDEFVFRDDDSKVSAEDFNEISKRLLIRTGDVQLAIVGATLGKVAIVKDLPESFVTQRSVATLRVNDKCLAEYLFYFIKTTSFQSFLWLNAGFSAQPGIYLGTIQNSQLPLPKIEEQKEIVNYIDSKCSQIETQVERTEKLIELLREYKTTLISEAVTGKIKVG